MIKIKFPDIYINESNKNIVAVLGKFESMHLGHLELIKRGRELCGEHSLDLMLMMFSQRKENNIYSFEERLAFANNKKINYVLEFEPTKENFIYSWEEFNTYLKNMGVTHIVCGLDFAYGHNRRGNISTLERDFKVTTVEEIKFNGERIKTTRLIEAVANDDLDAYKNMTNHYFFFKGEVCKGLGNGRKFGTPTANVKYPEYKLHVNEGIYYSYVLYEGRRLPSLTSISNNPTLEAKEVTYETYIYDFDQDIYGEEIYVELIEKYRDSIKFDSIDELIEKLEEDKKLGREYFNI